MPSLIDQVLAISDRSEHRAAILCLLSRLAPDRRDVFDRVLAWARPAPPDIRYTEGEPRYPYDAAMWRRGPAVEALGNFRVFAGEAVAVLADAMDSFEEYDPDWGYENGEHGRVIDALSRIGPPAALAALPAVLRQLRNREGEVDWRIVRFLGELGPAAREALPALQRVDAQLSSEDKDGAGRDKPGDLNDPGFQALHPLGWAIARITQYQ